MNRHLGLYLILSFVCFAQEENPFSIKERFEILDKADNAFFSTIKKELKKEEVEPAIVTIDFKKTPLSTETVPTPLPSAQKKQIVPTIMMQKTSKDINNALFNAALNKALEAQKKREKKRQLKAVFLELKKKKRLDAWIQKHVVNIDLLKEKKEKEKYLDDLYEKAVDEVTRP